MIDSDRLDELSTYTTEEDTPDDARVSLPWRDLRDLVSLIPVVRAAMAFDDDEVRDRPCWQTELALSRALAELRAKGDG